jgi:hypothetical protein
MGGGSAVAELRGVREGMESRGMRWRAACSLRHQPCTYLGNYRGRISATLALTRPLPALSLYLSVSPYLSGSRRNSSQRAAHFVLFLRGTRAPPCSIPSLPSSMYPMLVARGLLQYFEYSITRWFLVFLVFIS